MTLISAREIGEKFHEFIQDDSIDHNNNVINLAIDCFEQKRDLESFHEALRFQSVISLLTEKIFTFPYHLKEIEWAISFAKGRVLDYGAGIGDLTLNLARNNFDVTYHDINSYNNSFAYWLFKQYNLELKADINGKYDTVFCLNVLDHSVDPVKIIKSIYTLMNENAILVFSGSFSTEANPLHLCDAEKIAKLFDFLGNNMVKLTDKDSIDKHTLYKKVIGRNENQLQINGIKREEPLLKCKAKKSFFVLNPFISIYIKGENWNVSAIDSGQFEIEDELLSLLIYLGKKRSFYDIQKFIESTYHHYITEDFIFDIINELFIKRIIYNCFNQEGYSKHPGFIEEGGKYENW